MSVPIQRVPDDLDVACHLNVLLAQPSSDLLPAALDALAARGYRRVVLPPVDPDAFDAAAARRTFASRGITPIPIAGQSPHADVSSADPEIRDAGIAELRRALELAVRLGADQLNGVPYGVFARAAEPPSPDAIARSAAAVGQVAEEAHERGVRMTFEVLNRYETSMLNTAEQAMAFAERSGSPHLGIHLDTFHMAVEEADMRRAIRAALPRLAFLELGQSGRGPLSTGAVDIAEVVRGALDDGYTGRWGVEAFSAAVLSPPARSALAIWREPFRDGTDLANDAAHVIRTGWARSTAGRRAARLARRAAAGLALDRHDY